MKLRIAHVVCVFPPYKGGIGSLAAQNAKLLARAGHDVTVFTPHYDHNKPAQEDRDGYVIKRLPALLKFGNAAFAPSIYSALKDFDVVHLHYPFFGVAEVVWLLKIARGTSLKLVITYHMDVIGEGATHFIFSAHRNLLMRSIVNSADLVIGTSRDYLEHSDINYLVSSNPEKIKVIPPAIDVHHFTPMDGHPVGQRHGIDKNIDRVILFVGGMDPAHYFKGLEVLLQAVSSIKNKISLKAIIIGSGSLQSKYKEQAKNLGITENIIFAGSVSYNDLPEYYSFADLFVLPSIDKSEAFGIVSAESLACGTPILVSDLPGVRTVAEGGVGSTFVTGDVEALSLRLKEMLGDLEILREMGMQGRKKALDEYAEEVVLEKLIDVYKKI